MGGTRVGRGTVARWASLGAVGDDLGGSAGGVGNLGGSNRAFRVDQSLLGWLLRMDGHLHCRAGHGIVLVVDDVEVLGVLRVVVVVGIGGGRSGNGGGDGQTQILGQVLELQTER